VFSVVLLALLLWRWMPFLSPLSSLLFPLLCAMVPTLLLVGSVAV